MFGAAGFGKRAAPKADRQGWSVSVCGLATFKVFWSPPHQRDPLACAASRASGDPAPSAAPVPGAQHAAQQPPAEHPNDPLVREPRSSPSRQTPFRVSTTSPRASLRSRSSSIAI